VLHKHNTYRCTHGVPPLDWDDDLAKGAQAWADRGVPERSPQAGAEFGENVAWGPLHSGADAVEFWYNESRSTQPSGMVDEESLIKNSVAQFTQLVWRSSLKMGCGRSRARHANLWVCRYSPAGNRATRFASDLSPPSKQAGECTARKTKRFRWAFAGADVSCMESGFVEVAEVGDLDCGRRPGVCATKYRLLSAGVDASAAGVPAGSTKDGTYTLAMNTHDDSTTVMGIDMLTASVLFAGELSTADGGLRLSPQEPTAPVLLISGTGHGSVPARDCEGEAFWHFQDAEEVEYQPV
jgi:hypothetical protein